MTDAAEEFPDDLSWKVTYDPTYFVSATIREVQKTLIEAFVLVVIVVFLFLGNLRATLIPAVAVPVSLIGAFIVLNAIGYSVQHGVPVGGGAGDRHRGGRRDRRGGSGRER